MHLGYQQETRMASCHCLHHCHDLGPEVVYVDSAGHEHKAVVTAVITDKYRAVKNSCCIICTIPKEMEEVAIALAIATADVRRILSDSKIAVHNFSRGCVSPSAHRILDSGPAPQLKVILIWTATHSRLQGYLGAHTSARKLAYQVREITGQEMASESRQTPKLAKKLHQHTDCHGLSVHPHMSLIKGQANAWWLQTYLPALCLCSLECTQIDTHQRANSAHD